MKVLRAQRRAVAAMVSILALAGVAGCSSTGTSDNPLVRKASWFSYLNGDDLRSACRAGAPDQFRLVFNGRYDDQVRVYELGTAQSDGQLKEKVLTSYIVNQGFTLDSLQERLSGVDIMVPMSATEQKALWETLAHSGAFDTARAGTRLNSDDLWWTVSGCHQGQVFFQVWPLNEATAYPPFFASIAALDRSGLPFPSAAKPPVTTLDSPRDRTKSGQFQMEVGDGGFIR